VTSSFRLTNGLPLSEETILRWIRNKELKAYRLGKTYRVTKEEYQEFLDQRYTGKSDEDQRNYLLLSQLDIVEYGIPAPISDTANIVRPGPESTAPKRFLHLREGLKYFAGGCSFYLVRNLGRGNRWRSRKKEMDMVWLDVYRANREVALLHRSDGFPAQRTLPACPPESSSGTWGTRQSDRPAYR